MEWQLDSLITVFLPLALAIIMFSLGLGLTLDACKVTAELAAEQVAACSDANARGLQWAILVFATLYGWAAIHYLLAGKITGQPVGFRHGMALVSWSSMPMLLGSLVLWDRLLQEFIVYLRDYSRNVAQMQDEAVAGAEAVSAS